MLFRLNHPRAFICDEGSLFGIGLRIMWNGLTGYLVLGPRLAENIKGSDWLCFGTSLDAEKSEVLADIWIRKVVVERVRLLFKFI